MAVISSIPVISLGIWVFQLDRQIRQPSLSFWFHPSTRYYSRPLKIFPGQVLSAPSLVHRLETLGLKKKPGEYKHISPHTYALWEREKCQMVAQVETCLVFRTQKEIHWVGFTNSLTVEATFSGQPLQEVPELDMEPQIFAQFHNGKPILRSLIHLGEVPLYCLQAITAIEDNRFLDHKGISPISIFRAALQNIIHMKVVEGASTITQQLVKNYFLTHKKTLRRKLKEVFMAMLLELRLDKDEILQHYLNVIYMGQSGPFEVRGYGAASTYYFKKPISSLNLSECALLAAIVNRPGYFHPLRHPKRARQRRNLVLEKMMRYNMIGEDKKQMASQSPLPQQLSQNFLEPAPYYIQAVRRELKKLNIESSKGLNIYTSVDLQAQEMARQSLQSQVLALEKKLSKGSGDLQSLLISVRLDSGEIIAMEGGRGYQQTQYNRALDAHRQVGSLMKVFVYLAALESVDERGRPYSPLSLLDGSPLTYEYEGGQSWTPKNYEKSSHQSVPMFYALKNSINIPTARLGLKVGLHSIVDVARRVGIYSKIRALPSVTLGAFELYPLEVAEAFTTLARFGSYLPLSTISKVESLDGKLIYERKLDSETRISSEVAAVVVGMMKQILVTGTARSLSLWRGFTRPAAGKTGTTNETKDAWFVGFTPHVLTLVWVGYDDNRSIGLTGASGALPIWSDFMKNYTAIFPPDDFSWPNTTHIYEYKARSLREKVPDMAEYENISHYLVFRQGNEPEE